MASEVLVCPHTPLSPPSPPLPSLILSSPPTPSSLHSSPPIPHPLLPSPPSSSPPLPLPPPLPPPHIPLPPLLTLPSHSLLPCSLHHAYWLVCDVFVCSCAPTLIISSHTTVGQAQAPGTFPGLHCSERIEVSYIYYV